MKVFSSVKDVTFVALDTALYSELLLITPFTAEQIIGI